MAPIDIGARIRAARMLVGMTSAQALADRINKRGFSYKTIYPWEQNKKTPSDQQLQVVADACGVPLSFFTVDFHVALGGREGDAMQALADRVAALELERLTTQKRFGELDEVLAMLRRREAGGLPGPPDGLLHKPADQQPRTGTSRRARKRPAAGSG